MKKIILIIASLFLAMNVASAKPIQNDLNFVFGNSVKVQQITLLDHSQMSEIKGKGWGSFKRAFKKASRFVSKATKKFGKKVNWTKNRYSIIKYGIIGASWYMGYPITSSGGTTTITYW